MGEDLAKLARGLSKEARGFVTMPLMSGYGITDAWFHDNADQLARTIYRKGLATRKKACVGTSAAIPTPLGIALRDYLRSNPNG